MQTTYWYHPESESYYIEHELMPDGLGDGMSVEIDEYRYVNAIIDKIDQDPLHKLPEGVDAIIKLAAHWPSKCISGMIWYDKYQRFSNGHPITTSRIIKREPGGIYHTKNSAYLVQIVTPKESAIAKQPGEMING